MQNINLRMFFELEEIFNDIDEVVWIKQRYFAIMNFNSESLFTNFRIYRL